jgi:hypothetical protein
MNKRRFYVSLLAPLWAVLACGLWAASATAAVTQISAGEYHTCAVKSDGSVACWGRDYELQSVPADGTYTQVSSGDTHTCGLKTDGNIVCWGKDNAALTPTGGSFTQVSVTDGYSCGLRDGNVICTNTSFNMTGGASSYISSSYSSSYGGGGYLCSIDTGGSVSCTGYYSPKPLPASSITFKQISAGFNHACGVRTSGGVMCWGNNSSNETAAPSGTFTQVSSGLFYSCGVKSDGSLVCWGRNDYGQAVPPSGTFTQVSTGREHACGIKTDGTVVCWGNNSSNKQTTLPSGLNADVVVTPPATTYTQTQLDAAVAAAKTACASNPASCGITSSSGFTQAQLDAAAQQAKQACVTNPASCGITVNQNTDGSTQAGIDQCKADPNCKGTTVASTHALYDPAKGELHVPFVDVGTLGLIQTFDVYLMQRSGEFTFDLDLNRITLAK